MYQHQMIKDITSIGNMTPEFRKGQTDLVMSAEAYFFGNMIELTDKLNPQLKILDGDYGESFRIPYPTTLFEFEIENSRHRTYRATAWMREIEQEGMTIVAILPSFTNTKDTLDNAIPGVWQNIRGLLTMAHKKYHPRLMNMNWSLQLTGMPGIKKYTTRTLEPGVYYLQATVIENLHGQILYLDENEQQSQLERVKQIIAGTIAGLKLLACKNVITRVEQAPKKLNKKRAKANKPLIAPYRKLYINPMGAKTVYSEHVSMDLIKNLTHFPGQFRTYTKEKPLFGKHSGTWWWNSWIKEGHEKDRRERIVKY